MFKRYGVVIVDSKTPVHFPDRIDPHAVPLHIGFVSILSAPDSPLLIPGPPTSLMLLAVETSGMQGSLAISEGELLLAERTLKGEGFRHAQSLVSEVDRVFRDLNLQPSDIGAAAVSIGPGSFTGVRVGLVFAKTFAWLNHAKLVAVDTLRAIAQQVPPEIEAVTVISDAQRGELFTASYRWDADSGCRQQIDNVHLSTVEALSKEYPLVGPALQKLRVRLEGSHQLLDETFCQPIASTVARIGLDMVRRGQLSIPETLEPVYIRPSYAEEKRDRPPNPSA